MISVREYSDGTCDVVDCVTGVCHHILSADLPVYLLMHNIDPRPLSSGEAHYLAVLEHFDRYGKCYDYDPECQRVFAIAHQYRAGRMFKDWVATRDIRGKTISEIKCAFEQATGRYAGGASQIRKLLETTKYVIDEHDRVHLSTLPTTCSPLFCARIV